MSIINLCIKFVDMTYFLILFAKSQKQEDFVNIVAENLSYLTINEDVKFYFGPESSIYKFTSNYPIKKLSSEIKNFFKNADVAYFLTEYQPDNMTFQIPEYIEKFFMESKTEVPPFETFIQNLNQLDEVNSELDSSIHNLVKELYEMENLVPNQKKLSLDEILEKINKVGMSGLTVKELNLLQTYSKEI